MIEAPYILGAAAKLGVSPATATIAYAYGDMVTNLIQPFWAIPLLSVARLKFGEILGYCALFSVLAGLLAGIAMLWIPPGL